MTVYQKLRDAGVPIDNHYSDLYCEASLLSKTILDETKTGYSAFTNQNDGKLWYEIPFAFDPYWERRETH